MADAMKPWYTSDDLINAVKRKISFPISQNTFTEDEILAFANEEMMISQVPSVLSFHEEYFVYSQVVALEANKSRYPIPERAIGMRLRDLFWKDEQNSLYEMVRVSSEDKAFYQDSTDLNTLTYKYYLEGNDVVLTPNVKAVPSGSLVFYYFIRPNQLVRNERAAIINAFAQSITVNNASVVAGDTVTINDIVYTAVAGAPSTNEFQIGGTSIATATNLNNAINTNAVITSNNGSPSTNILTLTYKNSKIVVTTSNALAFVIPTTESLQFNSVPANIVSGAIIDFLQTKPGHRIRSFDVEIPSNAVSGNIISFTAGTVPTDIVFGDYICLANEAIIPYLPPDLHNVLAERTGARILAAIGDEAGLTAINTKIQDMEVRQGTLLDNRVEGSNAKITNRKSLLHFGRMGWRRRY